MFLGSLLYLAYAGGGVALLICAVSIYRSFRLSLWSLLGSTLFVGSLALFLLSIEYYRAAEAQLDHASAMAENVTSTLERYEAITEDLRDNPSGSANGIALVDSLIVAGTVLNGSELAASSAQDTANSLVDITLMLLSFSYILSTLGVFSARQS